MKGFILVAILATLLCMNANAQVPNFLGVVSGECKNPPVLQGFNAASYSGRWYEIERVDYQFEKDLDCVTADYGFVNSTYLTVENNGVNT